MKLRLIIIVFINIQFINVSISQSLTSSPYSIFGVGEIRTKGSSRNFAMGGAGIALKSETVLNNSNPASYNEIDSLFFIYELGFFTEYSKFSTKTDDQSSVSGNLSNIAIGFRAKNRWGISVGLAPFSTVGYNIKTYNDMVNDNSIYTNTYVGDGGINQVYFGNSFKLTDHISLGVNLSYLFGSFEEDEEISFSGGDYVDYRISDQNYVKGFYIDYGLQFRIPVKNYEISLGAIYGHKRNLSSYMDRTIYEADEYVLYTEEDLESQEDYVIPRKVGIGLALSRENKFTMAFDYALNQWSEIEFSNSDLNTKDSHKFALGFEFSPEGRFSNNTLKSWYYRLGAYYNSSYLEVDNYDINSMAITAGFGIPINRNLSMLNIAFEYGKNGTISGNLIEENFYTLSLNMSLQDLWFMKRKFD